MNQILLTDFTTCVHICKKISKIPEEIPQPDISAFPVLVLGLCIILIKWRHVQRYWHSSAFDTTRRKVFHGFYLTLLTLLKEEVYFNGRYISEWTRKCFTKGWHGGKISRWNLSETDKVPLLFDNYLRIFINHQTVS